MNTQEIVTKDHVWYMEQALKEAGKAFEHNEVPIGAVVVDPGGVIIGRGYNLIEKRQHQSAHAEIIALQKASKKINNWRLNGCWLYVTLEPCAMCMALVKLSRMEGVVYGASSPLFGYRLDNYSDIPLYKKNALSVVTGICQAESTQLLKKFFSYQRKVKRE